MMKYCKKILLGFVLAIFAPSLSAQQPLPVKVAVDDPLMLYSGRRDDSQKGEVRSGYSGTMARLAFVGESIGMWMDSSSANWMNVYVDGKRLAKIKVLGAGNYYELASGLPKSLHTVEVVRATEGNQGVTSFKGFALPEGSKPEAWPEKETRKIEFIGDSITCGYGIEVNDPKIHFTAETENFCDTYAWLAARNLKADFLVVACSGIGMLRNYNGPVDGSEGNMPNLYDSTLFKVKEPVWDFTRFVPDVVCINLGTNDFSTTGPNLEKFEANYLAFAEKLISRYPQARFVLLQGPMQDNTKLKEILQRLVEKLDPGGDKKVSYFQLSKAGSHGFGADYHPSQEQGKINGAELTQYLSTLMQWPFP